MYPKLLPVKRSSGLYVHARHPDAVAADRRFAGLLRSTWDRLPRSVRRRIVRYWREASGNLAVRACLRGQQVDAGGYLAVPVFELVSDWSHRHDCKDNPLGMASAHGCRVEFRADVVGAMPDAIVMDLIAHELGHVHECAIGSVYGGEAEEEFCVNELVAGWGFEVDTIDKWCRRQEKKAS